MPISHVLRPRRASVLLPAAAVLVLASCGAPDASLAPPVDPSRSVTSTTATHLLQCAGGVTQTTSATIGTSGGSLSLGSAYVSMPYGAVGTSQEFEASVLAGDLVGVEVHAVGETSYRFQQPVTITIDYSRCGSVQGPLRVWYIDPVTHELIEDMGGVNDMFLRTISFQTTHLSVYAVAN